MKTVLTIDDIWDQLEAKHTWQLHADRKSEPSAKAKREKRIADSVRRAGI